MDKTHRKLTPSSASISRVLNKVPFGLTSDEISIKIGITKKNTEKLLNAMTGITKTKAGRIFFYRIAAVLILLALIPFSYSEELTSTNYKIVAEIVDAGGGNANTTTNRTMLLSLSHVSSVKLSESYELCAGFLCSFLDILSVGRVTFALSFNINGSNNDQFFVDNLTEAKRYEPGELLNYYVCMQDTSLASNPVIGIIFAGSNLDYVRVAPADSFNIRIAQDIQGNKFIIPVTSGGCGVVSNRMQQIAQYGTILQPFVIFSEAVNAVELALDYRAFDIYGTFDKTGPFTLVIEKNQTNDNQIIIKPE